jgi:PleD family two-component response regulator
MKQTAIERPRRRVIRLILSESNLSERIVLDWVEAQQRLHKKPFTKIIIDALFSQLTHLNRPGY